MLEYKKCINSLKEYYETLSLQWILSSFEKNKWKNVTIEYLNFVWIMTNQCRQNVQKWVVHWHFIYSQGFVLGKLKKRKNGFKYCDQPLMLSIFKCFHLHWIESKLGNSENIQEDQQWNGECIFKFNECITAE